MASRILWTCLLCFGLVLSLFITVHAGVDPGFIFKAVNLGGWLVTEGWIEPSLFDGIPNKDMLDGTQVQFKSVKLGKYLCAEGGGGSFIVANSTNATDWETFGLWRITENKFQFRVFNKQFVGVGRIRAAVIYLQANADSPSNDETFEIIRKPDDPYRVHIKALNGFFVQAKTEERVTADFQGEPGWEDNNPAVFLMSIVGTMQGEFQITNGYGPVKAKSVMNEHWKNFIVEEDFKLMSEKGINSVRIPVGWWIARGPDPPEPFVGGSLSALDRAFSWAQKYDLKVIIDLHAAPGSQNGFENSASRDGSQEFGETDKNIAETVAVIDFLASRYGEHPSLGAVELLNEPLPPGVTLEALIKYYNDSYQAVRKYTSTAPVIMSVRLGAPDPIELFPLAEGLPGTVIDIHFYNLYLPIFDNMTVQENIDYIYDTRNAQLKALENVTQHNNPPIFIGEWVAEWEVHGASKEDYQRFAKAQLEVYGQATFGWSYWTWKNVENHWSLEWMINNKYITL